MNNFVLFLAFLSICYTLELSAVDADKVDNTNLNALFGTTY